jgi:WD40 repeat protein
VTLTPALDHAQSGGAQLGAAIYRASIGIHRLADPAVRRQLLAVDAARCGVPELGRRLAAGAGTAGWQPRWATGTQIHPAHLLTLTGPAGSIHAIACGTVNGRPVAVAGGGDNRLSHPDEEPDHTVWVWDLTTGQPLHGPLIGHTEKVCGAACTTVAVTADEGGTVYVWDLISGRPRLRPFAGHPYMAFSVACTSLAGRPVVVIAGNAGIATVWDLSTGRLIRTLTVGDRHTVIYAVDCTTIDGRPVAVVAASSVQVFDMTTGKQRGVAHDYYGSVRALACTTVEGRPAAIAMGMYGTRVVDLVTMRGRRLATGGWDGQDGAVAATCVGDRPVAVTVRGNTAHVWDPSTGLRGGRGLDGHTQPVYALATGEAGTGPVVVSGGWDRTARVWDLTRTQADAPEPAAHNRWINAVACTGLNGRAVAVSGSLDGTVRVWDLATGQQIAVSSPPQSDRSIEALVCTKIGGRPVVVTGIGSGRYSNGGIQVLDLATCELLAPPYFHIDASVEAVAFARVGGRPALLTAGGIVEEPIVDLWDLEYGIEYDLECSELEGHTAEIEAIACTKVAGRPVAVTGGFDSTVRAWDLRTMQALGRPMAGHAGTVRAIACTKVAGRPIAVTGSDDQTVRIWDVATGQPIHGPLTGHAATVSTVACTKVAGRPVAVTGSRDGGLRTWDLATRECMDAQLLPDTVSALAATSNGTVVAAINRDLVVLDRIGQGEPWPAYWESTESATFAPK